MNQAYNKNLLTQAGWKCKPCSCSGSKKYDCLNESFRGIVIRLNVTGSFKIYKRGSLIDSGLPKELQQKLIEHELTQTSA